jgi:DNA helicase HerA-like ATPase
MDMLKLIARRGRKRWLCLGFVSQQPSHLPNEIFELCNTRIIHSIKSEINLSTLKATVGGVRNEIWEMIPNLGPGEALIICPQFTHPLIVEMRPAKCERKFIT